MLEQDEMPGDPCHMSDKPLISISLPTRNRLKTIQRTIGQILAQTFTNWELIITDNASDEPGKADYLKQLAAADARVKLHLQPVNIGIHANWIFGVNQSSGRYYIATTDDDRWGEADYLEQLLAMHDGKTGVVYPNLSIESHLSGEFQDKVLTRVYSNDMTRHEICDRMVKDRRGIVMMGLFDLQIVPKTAIVSVYEHGRHEHCETVGMIRMVRDYPTKFCSSVSYIHIMYEGNYSRSFAREVVLRDGGIGTFQLLDELRLAAAQDPGYEAALNSQWHNAIRYCRDVMNTYEVRKGAVKYKKKKGPIRTFLSTQRKALKAWLKGKRLPAPTR
jgi:glycosyltransferase involved in cell wall biosynthesis